MRTYTFEFPADISIEEVKKQLSQIDGVEFKHQRVVAGGRQRNDTDTLEDLVLTGDNAVLWVVETLPTARKDTKKKLMQQQTKAADKLSGSTILSQLVEKLLSVQHNYGTNNMEKIKRHLGQLLNNAEPLTGSQMSDLFDNFAPEGKGTLFFSASQAKQFFDLIQAKQELSAELQHVLFSRVLDFWTIYENFGDTGISCQYMYDRALPMKDTPDCLLSEASEFVLKFSHLNLLSRAKFQGFAEFLTQNL